MPGRYNLPEGTRSPYFHPDDCPAISDVIDLRVRCFAARVRWLPAVEPSHDQESGCISWGSSGVAYQYRTMRDRSEIEEFEAACRNMPSLIDDWIGCVRAKGRERFPGHLEVRGY